MFVVLKFVGPRHSWCSCLLYLIATKGCGLTSISFNEDGHMVATRALDDMVKLWDIRKLGGGVVKTFTDVPTHLVSSSQETLPK